MRQQEMTTQIVERADGGQTVVITQSDGTVQRINVAPDGKVVTSNLEGTTTGTAPVVLEPPRRKALPDGLVDMMGIIFGSVTLMTLGTPIVKAWARRFDKRTEMKQQGAVDQRLAAIEQAIESVAIEVERISEGQRFTTKLLADRSPAEMERVR